MNEFAGKRGGEIYFSVSKADGEIEEYTIF